MAQLNFYVPDKFEEVIRREAQAKGESLSAYLARLVKEHIQQEEWPKDFFTTVVGRLSEDFPDEIEREFPEEVELL